MSTHHLAKQEEAGEAKEFTRIGVSFPTDLLERLSAHAKRQHRSVSAQLAFFAERGIEQDERTGQ